MPDDPLHDDATTAFLSSVGRATCSQFLAIGRAQISREWNAQTAGFCAPRSSSAFTSQCRSRSSLNQF